jgi:uncharacterized cupin superfamily protein
MAEQTPAPKDPIVNIDALEFTDFGRGHEPPGMGVAPPDYQAKVGFIGPRLGAKQLGYNLTVLPPGKRAFPLHNHRYNEEMFFIVEGRGEIRIGKDAPTRPIRAGDVIACLPGGHDTAHQIVNTSDAELKYLAVSSKIDPEICDYPEFGTFGVLSGNPPFRYIGKEGESLTYFPESE